MLAIWIDDSLLHSLKTRHSLTVAQIAKTKYGVKMNIQMRRKSG